MKNRVVIWESIIECPQERTKYITCGTCTTLNFILLRQESFQIPVAGEGF